MRISFTILAVFLLSVAESASAGDRSQLITEDTSRFVSVIAAGDFGGTLEARLQARYLDPGTPGLDEYSKRFGLTADSLAARIREYPAYYRSLADIESRIEAQAPLIHAALSSMQALYPDTDLGPVYFVVGAMRAGGQNSSVGALIAVEMYAADPYVAAATPAGQNRLFPSSQLPVIVAHEMAHRQQVRAQGLESYLSIYGDRQSVLANAIREGTAEFMALMTAGSTTDPKSYAFGVAHEAEIWSAFDHDKLNREYSDWFYYPPKDREGWPADLGYFVGARIVEAYYRMAPDKEVALGQILGVTDYEKLLRDSGYGAESFQLEPGGRAIPEEAG